MSTAAAAPVRIAVWSGPRNISTAMMRAFAQLPGTVVVDEPFYACYLHHSGADHPMREEILASQPRDSDAVVAGLRAPLAPSMRLQYQKQMTHHMLAPLDSAWVRELRHAFLIRDPKDMAASYLAKRPTVTAEDLGVARQRALFEEIAAATGTAPPIVDAQDVAARPGPMLEALCAGLGIAYDAAMLSWTPGLRDSDGVWAPHWYNAVAQSTGFAPYSRHDEDLPAAAQRVVDACRPHYEALWEQRLR